MDECFLGRSALPPLCRLAFSRPSGKSSWQRYRDIILVADGNVADAAKALEAAANETGNSMFLEALGAAQADDGDLSRALSSIEKALAMDNKPLDSFPPRSGKARHPSGDKAACRGSVPCWMRRRAARPARRRWRCWARSPTACSLPPPTPTPLHSKNDAGGALSGNLGRLGRAGLCARVPPTGARLTELELQAASTAANSAFPGAARIAKPSRWCTSAHGIASRGAGLLRSKGNYRRSGTSRRDRSRSRRA